jgi:hypothetical protein
VRLEHKCRCGCEIAAEFDHSEWSEWQQAKHEIAQFWRTHEGCQREQVQTDSEGSNGG